MTIAPDVDGCSAPVEIRATLMRGGTSKCWVFRDQDLPSDPGQRDALLVRIFGSPDARQIDGVGGGTSTTSKALIVSGYAPGTDTVEYQFAQVSIDRNRVEWESNCGNCATAMGLYALQEGLVPSDPDVTTVRLLNTATGLLVETTLDTPGGRPPRDGEIVVPGTIYPGARVDVRFTPPSWSTYGPTLATGNPVDVFTLGGRRLRVTLVDAGAPSAFVHAADLGLGPLTRSSKEIDAWLPLLVELRHAAAERMGISTADADLQSIPKVGIVGPPGPAGGTDLEARMVSMTAAHPSIGITSSVALGAAVGVESGTVADVVDPAAAAQRGAGGPLAIGTMIGPVGMRVERSESGSVCAVEFERSARRLADATLYLPAGWAPLAAEHERTSSASTTT